MAQVVIRVTGREEDIHPLISRRAIIDSALNTGWSASQEFAAGEKASVNAIVRRELGRSIKQGCPFREPRQTVRTRSKAKNGSKRHQMKQEKQNQETSQRQRTNI